MVRLYFYQCPKQEDQHAFWQARLAEILCRDFGLANCNYIIRPGGKPALENDAIFFNVSHSRDQLVIAVADTEVGVDIECYDRTISERLRRHCLTEQELAQTPPDDAHAFIRIWTAKESYLKLYGSGLRQPMRSFCVLNDRFASPDLPPAILQRFERGEYTICVATKNKETLRIVQV